MDYIQIHPHGNPTTGGLQSHFAGVIKNSIYVNKEGNRFVAESERRDVITNATVEHYNEMVRNGKDGRKPYHLLHINALYDIKHCRKWLIVLIFLKFL